MNVNYIVHSADIQIRNTSRYHEFKTVLSNTVEMIKKLQPLCFVIAGDFFHSRLILSPESISLGRWFLKELIKYTKVVIIPGNHDININAKNRLDGISFLVEDLNSDKIIYYKKNGIYDYDNNIKFGVFSMLDEPDTYPIKFKKEEGYKYIALYHGTIAGAKTDLGRILDDGDKVDMFENYDMVMLGDIHCLQTVGEKFDYKEIDEDDLNQYLADGWEITTE
jgi:DNA repair exonuclease SbcCD nuclease subunit